jgi:hypothetical protein
MIKENEINSNEYLKLAEYYKLTNSFETNKLDEFKKKLIQMKKFETLNISFKEEERNNNIKEGNNKEGYNKEEEGNNKEDYNKEEGDNKEDYHKENNKIKYFKEFEILKEDLLKSPYELIEFDEKFTPTNEQKKKKQIFENFINNINPLTT